MEREYVIRIRLPRVLPRYALVLVALAILGTAAHVFATIKTQFTAGNKILAKDFSDNFGEISTRLGNVETGKVSQTTAHPLGAAFCGKTAATVGDLSDLNGVSGTSYSKARAACQLVSSCTNSVGVHMCSVEETYRSASLGVSVPGGWIVSGVLGSVPGAPLTDCVNFTSASASYGGMVGLSSGSQCSNAWPVLCCE